MIALALLQSAGSAAAIANGLVLQFPVIARANKQLTTLKTGDQALSKENP